MGQEFCPLHKNVWVYDRRSMDHRPRTAWSRGDLLANVPKSFEIILTYTNRNIEYIRILLNNSSACTGIRLGVSEFSTPYRGYKKEVNTITLKNFK
jgi:hypothetical protein